MGGFIVFCYFVFVCFYFFRVFFELKRFSMFLKVFFLGCYEWFDCYLIFKLRI